MDTVKQKKGISYDIQHLTDFDKKEIEEFQNTKDLYYVGTLDANQLNENFKIRGKIIYTNEDGNYRIFRNDHIRYRYQILQIIGTGAFSTVIRAHDHRDNLVVAIKILNSKFSKDSYLKEVKILTTLKKVCKNANSPFVKFRESFVFRNHFFVVTELLDKTLRDTVTSAGMEMDQIRKIIQQLLKGLLTLKLLGIVHSDLKPENITYNAANESCVKIIDFGLADYTSNRNPVFKGTPYYRSPENFYRIWYGTETDIWALGCISVELFTGKLLFPGKSREEQLRCMVETLGMPPKGIYRKQSIVFPFRKDKKKQSKMQNILLFEQSLTEAQKYVEPSTRSIEKVLAICKNKLFHDFVKECLKWDPTERFTPQQALNHPWICNTSTLTKTEFICRRSFKPSTALMVHSDIVSSREVFISNYIQRRKTTVPFRFEPVYIFRILFIILYIYVNYTLYKSVSSN